MPKKEKEISSEQKAILNKIESIGKATMEEGEKGIKAAKKGNMWCNVSFIFGIISVITLIAALATKEAIWVQLSKDSLIVALLALSVSSKYLGDVKKAVGILEGSSRYVDAFKEIFESLSEIETHHGK